VIERERKFLIKDTSYKTMAYTSYHVHQGYLSTDPERTVRLRQKGQNAYLTIKGASDESGTTRVEWEKHIDAEEALPLWKLCLPGLISKIRHEVRWYRHVIEVDEFLEENTGLVVAEIEFEGDDFPEELPEWIGPEVTGDSRYYNSALSLNPFSRWKN
jgi:CYTH domain-containing protein